MQTLRNVPKYLELVGYHLDQVPSRVTHQYRVLGDLPWHLAKFGLYRLKV